MKNILFCAHKIIEIKYYSKANHREFLEQNQWNNVEKISAVQGVLLKIIANSTQSV